MFMVLSIIRMEGPKSRTLPSSQQHTGQFWGVFYCTDRVILAIVSTT